MKKFIYIFMVLSISILFVACGAKNDSSASNKAATNITYTTKLAYLPSYNGVQPTEYTAAKGKTQLATSKYTIKNTTDAKVFEDYENTLKKDGWTITDSKKYNSIFAKKDTHMLNIIVQKYDKDVILQIMSK